MLRKTVELLEERPDIIRVTVNVDMDANTE